jgi:hypothetical protein
MGKDSEDTIYSTGIILGIEYYAAKIIYNAARG